MKLMTMGIVLALVACSKQTDKAGGDKAGSDHAKVGGGAATKASKIEEGKAIELAKTPIDGFDLETYPPSQYRKANASMKYTTKTEPKVDVVVDLGPCEMCQKMDLAVWQANPNLKQMLSSGTLSNPKHVWKVEAVELGGKQAMSTYVLSYTESADGKSRGSANAYNIWFNDGVNQLHMQTGCSYPLAESVRDEASLEATCPRDAQLAAAQRVAAAFASVF